MDGGSTPPELDKDGPAIMAVATLVANEDAGPAKPQVSELSPSPLAQHSSFAGQEIPV
jgi:hypothetical protein